MKDLLFKNPANGYEVCVQYPAFGCLVCGPLYLGLKGAWLPAIGYFVLTLVSVGFFWLILPFLATGIFRRHYLGKGWEEREAPPREMRLWGSGRDATEGGKSEIDIVIIAFAGGCVISGGLLAALHVFL